MVVSNTTTLLYFTKLGRIDLLKNIYKSIIITTKVLDELNYKDKLPGYEREINTIKRAIDEKYIIIQEEQKKQKFGLDAGETSAISLCSELGDAEFLSDDKAARMTAQRVGLNVKGTLFILLKNVQLRKIDCKEFFHLLNSLIQHGYYISPDLYAQIVQKMTKV